MVVEAMGMLQKEEAEEVQAQKGKDMSRQRWPLLEGVNWIEMLSYLGTSPLAERQISDEMEWVITGVWDNTFNGVVRAQLSDAQVDQVIDDVTARFRERNVPHQWFLNEDSRPANLQQFLVAHVWERLPEGVGMGEGDGGRGGGRGPLGWVARWGPGSNTREPLDV